MTQLLDRRTWPASASAEPVPAIHEREPDLSMTGPTRRQCALAQWDECISAAADLLSLEHDWDGEGALPPRADNVLRAIHFINALRSLALSSSPPVVAPGLTGEVILKWRKGGASLHAEICRPDKFEWMAMDATGNARHSEDDGQLESVASFLR